MTIWSTSLFPDSNQGAYLLPVKKPRPAAAAGVGDRIEVQLELA